MIVTKRDGRQVPFDKNKIKVAILKAMNQGSGIPKEKIAEDIANEIEEEIMHSKRKFPHKSKLNRLRQQF